MEPALVLMRRRPAPFTSGDLAYLASPYLTACPRDLFTRTRERNLERYRRCLSGRTPRTPPPASCQGAVTHSKRVSEKTRAGGVARVADKCTSYEASPNNEDRSPFGPTLGDAFVAGVRR